MLIKKNKGLWKSKSKCASSTVTWSNGSAKRLQWTETQKPAALVVVLNKHLLGNKFVVSHEVPLSLLKDRLSGHMKFIVKCQVVSLT